MNCKPGDMAVIVRGEPLEGKLVEVLYAAPTRNHKLPDGYQHVASAPNSWIVKFLGAPISARIGENGRVIGERDAAFGRVEDWRLRPLRGEPEPESTDEREALNAGA